MNSLSKRRLENAVRRDPVAFCAYVLGEKVTVADVLEGRAAEANALWKKQMEIMYAIRDHKRVVVGSGHSIGKTHLIVRTMLWYLLSEPGSVVLVVAPKLDQVKNLIFSRARAIWEEAGFGGRAMSLELYPAPDEYPGWVARGFTSRKAEGLSGYHEERQLHIFDEASGIDDELYDAVEGMMSTEGARWLLIGNPIRATGRFAEAMESSDWMRFSISCLEHPNVRHNRLIYPRAVSPGWPASRMKAWGETSNIYKTRVLGELPGSDEDVLFPQEIMRNVWGETEGYEFA